MKASKIKKEDKKKFRKTVFFVTYFIEDSGEIKYLILRRKKHWKGWEFPKGGVERFESERMAVKREVKEETGQTPMSIKGFKVHGSYLYQKPLKDRPGQIGSKYKLYMVRIPSKKIEYDKEEHSGYRWLSFKDAKRFLTWENQKECLEIIDEWLREHQKD